MGAKEGKDGRKHPHLVQLRQRFLCFSPELHARVRKREEKRERRRREKERERKESK